MNWLGTPDKILHQSHTGQKLNASWKLETVIVKQLSGGNIPKQ
ncbi:hypothetical protein [Mesobacillus foraminis]|nr:hypothetical protein [Mesobacillus foraminis]